MTDEEDADVDSGWDLGDGPAKSPKGTPQKAPPPAKVIVSSSVPPATDSSKKAITEPSRLVAHAKKLIAKSVAPPKPSSPPLRDEGATISTKKTNPPPHADPLAATREAPAATDDMFDGRTSGGLDFEHEAAPVTRRATDEEMQLATARAKPSPDSLKARTVPNRTPALRLGSGRTATLKAEAPPQVRHDSRVHNRPTPPAFVHQPPPTPAPAAASAHTSLRFPATSLKDARARRPTTKINLNVAELLGGMSEGPAGGPLVDADVDLRSNEIDLEGNDSRPPRAPLSDPPVELDPLDDLPIEAAIESARKTLPPATRRSDAPPSKKTPLATPSAPAEPPRAAPTKPKMSLAERMAGVVDQLTRGEADQKPEPSVPPPREAQPTKEIVRSAAPTKPGAKPVEVPKKQSSGRNAATKKTAPQGMNRVAITPAVNVLQAQKASPPPEADAELEIAAVSLSADELASLESLEAPFPPKAVGSMLALDEPGALSVAGDSAPPLLDESDPPPPQEPEDPALLPIAQRFERGDYLGALLRAEALLETRPDYAPARRYFESAQDMLKQMYLEKLGSGECVLRLAMAPSQIQGLALDHRSGFLISLIDGMATVDEILDMSGMPQLDALRLLYEMREEGVVDAQSAS